MYVCMYMHVRMHVRACMLTCECVRVCVRVMNVTKTTHKYNYLNFFSNFLIPTQSWLCIRAANRNRYEITTR